MISKTALALTLAAGALLAPSQGFAYTCFNPAICKAICGAATCREATKSSYKPVARFSDSDKKRELSAAPRDSAVADVLRAVMSSDGSTTEGYTCWNPAICIAVCGKKTC
jgi:hypothetical protein